MLLPSRFVAIFAMFLDFVGDATRLGCCVCGRLFCLKARDGQELQIVTMFLFVQSVGVVIVAAGASRALCDACQCIFISFIINTLHIACQK